MICAEAEEIKVMSMLGRHHSEETKAKMCLANTGRHASLEAKANMRLAFAGRKGHSQTEETRMKMSLFRKGKLHTEEWNKKIGEAQKGEKGNMYGKHHSSETIAKMRGHIPWMKGKHQTEKAKEDLRQKALAQWARMTQTEKDVLIEELSGSNHHSWRGGVSFEKYSREFNSNLKKMIRKRDDYLCQNPECYLPENGKKHDVHHINFDKHCNDPVNLITLCRKHNIQANHGDLDYWTEYYQSIQEIRRIARTGEAG